MLRMRVTVEESALVWSEEISLLLWDRRAYKILCVHQRSLVFSLLHCIYVSQKEKCIHVHSMDAWCGFVTLSQWWKLCRRSTSLSMLFCNGRVNVSHDGLDRQSLSHMCTQFLQHFCGCTNNYSTCMINEAEEKSISIWYFIHICIWSNLSLPVAISEPLVVVRFLLIYSFD